MLTGCGLTGCGPALLDIPSTTALPLPAGDEVTLVGAGDIADCATPGAEATARLLDETPGLVFTLGDNAYPRGTIDDYLSCYHPTWGRALARTRPVLGNHEYHVPHAGAYFAYFGEAAGEPFKGYYSYDVGRWHVVVLNSNCANGELPSDVDVSAVNEDFGGCAAGSPQELWLRADLAAHPARCTLAMWHHPRFSSGFQGNYHGLGPMWRALDEGGADVLLVGHDHDYERFAPQHTDGTRDDEAGIRQFVVGTGGAELVAFGPPQPNSEVRQATTFGVLKLTLRAEDYDWAFIPVEGGPAFSDEGHGACH